MTEPTASLAITRILVPVDLCPGSCRAVERAVDLAAQAGASIDVLYVWDPLAGDGGPAHLVAERALEELVTPYWSRGVAIRGRIATGPPARIIPELARLWGSDLLLLETHGPGVSPGSVAETVLREAPCKVVTVVIPEEISDRMPGSRR